MKSLSKFFQRSELAAGLLEFRPEFLMVGALSFVVNVLMLSPTLFQLQITDRIFISKSVTSLMSLSVIIVFFFAVMALSEWIRSLALVRAGVRFDQRFASRIFRASFESQLKKVGTEPAQALSDLTNIRQFLTGNGIFAFFDAPWTPIYIAVVWMMHPILGIASLCFVALLFLQAIVMNRLTNAPNERAMTMGRETMGYVSSKLRNVEVIESMGMLPNLKRRWLTRYEQELEVNLEAEELGHRALSLSKFVRYVQQGLILGLGALLVIDGKLTGGQMIAVSVLMQRALQPVDMIVSSWRSFVYAEKSFLRLEDLLRANPEREEGVFHAPPTGAVRLVGLRFEVEGKQRPILSMGAFDFPKGRVTAVLGPSGSGKSTLAKAIVGILPGVERMVYLDDVSVERWDRDTLGSHIGYLPQDIELLDGTIAENIARFGEVESEKVIRAATRTGVHEMILRFPRGYDTPLGEASGILSGGQRQRIALARAIYGDPELLILDEPNSNLDDVGETALMKVVNELKSDGRTVILITHRPGILGVADHFLFLKEGAKERCVTREEILRAQQAGAVPQPT